VFRIRLPVTLSVKGEKKKNQKGEEEPHLAKSHKSKKEAAH
jgi:hypothetical protein